MNERRTEHLRVDLNPAEQTLAYIPGNGEVYWFLDGMTVANFPYMTPIERAVFVTRLRALADMAVAAGEDEATR